MVRVECFLLLMFYVSFFRKRRIHHPINIWEVKKAFLLQYKNETKEKRTILTQLPKMPSNSNVSTNGANAHLTSAVRRRDDFNAAHRRKPSPKRLHHWTTPPHLARERFLLSWHLGYGVVSLLLLVVFEIDPRCFIIDIHTCCHLPWAGARLLLLDYNVYNMICLCLVA